jgi:alginate O-acetyltransferase complex protein AlgI
LIFNTWSFAVFGLIAWGIYWACIPQRFKPAYLVAAGIVFYSFSVPAYLALICVLGAITFGIGEAMLASTNVTARSVAFAFGIIAIAGTLIAFKYTRFLALTVNQIAARDILPIPQIVVPLAISFFTFEFVHVLVDIRLGKLRSLDLLDFAVFTFFFPTLVAGPIKRYQSFAPQVRHIASPDPGSTLRNFYRVVLGVFKKVVLADSFSVLAQPLVTPTAPFHRLDYWVAFFAYAGKIYFDFTGYSDIAIGVAGLLGLKIPENFDRPYWSPNIAVFWRRWHISLSAWIRDYIFIPLGGSRRPPAIVLANLLVAMALAGLWHGAAWTFVIWGLWHGAGLAVQRLWSTYVVPRSRILSAQGRFVTAASIVLTFFFVGLGWVLFAATSLTNVGQIYRQMFLS